MGGLQHLQLPSTSMPMQRYVNFWFTYVLCLKTVMNLFMCPFMMTFVMFVSMLVNIAIYLHLITSYYHDINFSIGLYFSSSVELSRVELPFSTETNSQ